MIKTEARADRSRRFDPPRRAHVLTFQGPSGAEYDDPAGILALARQVLAARIPQIPLVRSSGKSSGVGAVYAVPRAVGVSTMWLGTSPSMSTCRCLVAAEGPCR